MSNAHRDRITNMGHFEPWFQRRFPVAWKRVTAKFVIVGLICGLAGFAFGFVADRAVGAEAGTHVAHRCVTSSGDPCPPPKKFAVRKFKHGKMGRVSGVKPGRVYAHPKQARKIWIRKINHKLAHQRPAFARGMSAAQLYAHTMNSATCAGHGSYNPYAWGIDVCTIQGPENQMSLKDIQNTGTVVFCGGGVVLGAITSEAGGWVIGWGAASCAWGAWLALSED